MFETKLRARALPAHCLHSRNMTIASVRVAREVFCANPRPGSGQCGAETEYTTPRFPDLCFGFRPIKGKHKTSAERSLPELTRGARIGRNVTNSPSNYHHLHLRAVALPSIPEMHSGVPAFPSACYFCKLLPFPSEISHFKNRISRKPQDLQSK